MRRSGHRRGPRGLCACLKAARVGFCLRLRWLTDMPAASTVVQRLFTQQVNVRIVKTFFATACAKFEPGVDAGLLRDQA
jgi:hypothetical protein